MNFLRLKGVAERLLTCGLQAGRITLCTYEATEHFHPRVSRLEREALTLCIPHLQDPGFPRCRGAGPSPRKRGSAPGPKLWRREAAGLGWRGLTEKPRGLEQPLGWILTPETRAAVAEPAGRAAGARWRREACAETTSVWLRGRANGPAAGRARHCGRGRGTREPRRR